MVYGIPEDIFGAWIASKNDILRANENARKKHWNARFKTENLKRLMDKDTYHFVSPMLMQNPNTNDEFYSGDFRCYIFLKLANKNEWVGSLMDYDMEELKFLRRPSEKELHNLIFELFKCQKT